MAGNISPDALPEIIKRSVAKIGAEQKTGPIPARRQKWAVLCPDKKINYWNKAFFILVRPAQISPRR